MNALLKITIGMDPELFEVFGLLVTWHGVFTAVGIIAGVSLAVRVASSPRVGIDADTAYSIGMVVVFSGLVGARALYVIENYGNSSNLDSFVDIFRITEGGISIWGAMIGGALGGWAYGLRKGIPAAAGADAAAFGMLLGLAIGRIGDIINGEHFAKATDLPWATYYSHVNSPAFFRDPAHPAVAYEMIGDLIILGVIALLWKQRPKSGVIFCTAFILYAIMRFFVSMLRIDSEEPLLGLSTPQLVSLVVLLVGTPLLAFFLKRDDPGPRDTSSIEARRAQATRAERRRRLRGT